MELRSTLRKKSFLIVSLMGFAQDSASGFLPSVIAKETPITNPLFELLDRVTPELMFPETGKVPELITVLELVPTVLFVRLSVHDRLMFSFGGSCCPGL